MVLVACAGFLCLLVARKFEELRFGKVHSIVWHYAIWGAFTAIVLIAGTATLITRPGASTLPKVDVTSGHGGRPLPVANDESK